MDTHGGKMSHTRVEHYKAYQLHGSSEKHDNGKWIGSFHVTSKGKPVISSSVLTTQFTQADEAAEYALKQGRLYIDGLSNHA